ncbi:hypothetical protein [Corynebacterium matruchotii]|nr:hypothetical protein [Corynebacterium matruchotii]
MTDPIRVLIVDDQQLLRREPARLLVKLTTVRVAAVCASAGQTG